MAFLIDSQDPYGFAAPTAYCRVESLVATKSTITFHLRRYKDENCSFAGFQDTEYPNVAYVLNGVNPLQQAYAYLRTLPEFASAVDVLEAGQPQA